MSRVKIALAVALLGAVMTVSAVAVAGGGGKSKTRLSGVEEVPAVLTEGKGKLKLKINKSDDTIDYVLSYSGLEGGSVTAAHIHIGQELANGGVAAFLCGGGSKPACPGPTAGEVEGTITATDVLAITSQQLDAGDFEEFVRAIRRGLTYANVHSTESPSGEIRGQINGDDDDSDDDDRGGNGGGDSDSDD